MMDAQTQYATKRIVELENRLLISVEETVWPAEVGMVLSQIENAWDGERAGQEPRVLQLNNPLGTVTAGGYKFATVSAFLAKHYGGNYKGAGLGSVWMSQCTL